MSSQIHQDIIDLIPAYALQALDKGEAQVVERHLSTCAACRAEVAAYENVVLELAQAAASPTPPTDLRRRVAAVARPAPGRPQAAATPGWAARLRAWLAPRPWRPVLAVLLVLLVAGVALVTQLEAPSRPPAITLEGTEAAPGASGVIDIGDQETRGELRISNLPPLTPEQQYQLWLIVDGERESGAIFSVAADGSTSITVSGSRPLESYDAFGITIEPAGGSPGPTGPRVMGSNL